MSSDLNQIRMDTFSGVLQAIVAPSHGSSAAHDLQLPRTRQDVTLEETSRRAQESASHPRVTPINTPITPFVRKETLDSVLYKARYGNKLDEPQAEQQNSANAQDREIDLPVDNPNQEEKEEEELPDKYPIAPQFCRRWRKPESYVIFDTRFPYEDL